jgi:putative transposase
MVRYRSVKADQTPLLMRIRDLARVRVRYGYFRICILLRREGWVVNHKRVHRLYREDGLSLRLKRPRRHVTAATREARTPAGAPNDLWSMDFLSNALFDGRRLRALTVVDAYTREALKIAVDQGSKANRLSSPRRRSRRPVVLQRPSGSTTARSSSRSARRWAYENGVTLDFSRPGKPTDNAFVESFNGKFRAECLDAHWFLSLDELGPRSSRGAGTTTRAGLTRPWAG